MEGMTKEQFNMLISMINDYSYSLVSNNAVQDVLRNGISEAEQEEIQIYINNMKDINNSINQVHWRLTGIKIKTCFLAKERGTARHIKANV